MTVNMDSHLSRIRSNRSQIFSDLSEITAFNSVHDEPGLEEEAKGAASWTANALRELGLEVQEIITSDGSTMVHGRLHVSDSAPTVLLYSHHDVVPTGDPEAWTSHPLTLTERDGRWYARGAADCKGNVVMHLAALRSVLEADNLSVNLIVVVEGSEERGGAGLDDLIASSPELFTADVIMIADTGNVAVGTPTLTSSLRGGAQLTATVDTLESGVHSGLFGGAAPDAVAALMRTLDTLKDENGATVLEGVDTPGVWPGELYDESTFRSDAGVLDGIPLFGEPGTNPAHYVWARPAVIITGFTSTPVAEAINAVPATAQARLNLRVPHTLNVKETAEALKKHLENNVAFGAKITVTIDDINPAFSTDTSSPAASTFGELLAQAYGRDSVSLVGSGGSIPLTAALQSAFPSSSILLYGVEEPLTTIHSVDESVDPTEIENIAAAEAAFLESFGQQQ